MRIREFVLLAVGFVIGAVFAALLTSAASRPVRKSSAQSVSQADTSMSQPPHNAPTPSGNQVDPATQSSLDTLLAATAAGDYDRFVSVLDDGFRQRMTPATFQSLSQGLAPRMQAGYTSTFLGHVRHRGSQISLWRVVFEDGGDDRLARITMSQDRVIGLLITPVL